MRERSSSPSGKEEFLKDLSRLYNLHSALASLLWDKGVRNPQVAKCTFEPSLNNLSLPETLNDLPEAIQIIQDQLSSGEPVVIWGHEDADGITAVSIMLKTIEYIGGKAIYHIPSKHRKGHGLNKEDLDKLLKQDYRFIITVDCCSSCIDEINYALQNGFKLVITDHHELPLELPPSPYINPKVNCGSYPYLSGAGVAFKLAWGLLEKNGLSLEDIKNELPEVFFYAMVGSIGDRVPIFSENKVLIEEGTEIFLNNDLPIKGAYKRIKAKSLEVDGVVQVISACKSKNGENIGVTMLLSRDTEELITPLQEVISRMEAWSERVDSIYNDALSMIKRVRNYILLDLKGRDTSLLGTVATKLKDNFNLPTIIIGRKPDGKVVGEIRTPYGIDSMNLLNSLGSLFLDYGGHKRASGFSMEENLLPELIEGVETYFRELDIEDTMMLSDVVIEKNEDIETLLQQLEELGKLGLNARILLKNTKLDKLEKISVNILNSSLENIPDKLDVLLEVSPSGIEVKNIPYNKQ